MNRPLAKTTGITPSPMQGAHIHRLTAERLDGIRRWLTADWQAETPAAI